MVLTPTRVMPSRLPTPAGAGIQADLKTRLAIGVHA